MMLAYQKIALLFIIQGEYFSDFQFSHIWFEVNLANSDSDSLLVAVETKQLFII